MKKETKHIGLFASSPKALDGYDITKPYYRNLQNHLEKLIEQSLQAFETIVCHSMAHLGADTVWSKAIINMKKKYPERVKFHIDLAFISQSSEWFRDEDIAFFYEQINQSDSQSLSGELDPEVSEQERRKTAVILLKQQPKDMMNDCDYLITLYNGIERGNVKENYAYAKELMDEEVLQCIELDPFLYHPKETKTI